MTKKGLLNEWSANIAYAKISRAIGHARCVLILTLARKLEPVQNTTTNASSKRPRVRLQRAELPLWLSILAGPAPWEERSPTTAAGRGGSRLAINVRGGFQDVRFRDAREIELGC